MSVKEVMSEIETLRNLKNDAILNLIEYYVVEEESHVYVITEILYGGAVLDAILKMKDERYTEAEAKVVVQRTLVGIEYMHTNLVVHRDLKLENLLLSRDDDLSSVIIVDFGLAKRCRDKSRCRTPRAWTTAPWARPCTPRRKSWNKSRTAPRWTCGASASSRTSW